jgi:hypothetical protein
MSQTKTTTDHKIIQNRAEARRGTPSKVKGSGDGGILRIDFGEPEPNLKPMDWTAFFDVNGEDGAVSRFNRFVSRTTR